MSCLTKEGRTTIITSLCADPEELKHHIQVYVPELVYVEYLTPSDDNIPVEDQPLPADASSTALSLGYVTDSNPKEDPANILSMRRMRRRRRSPLKILMMMISRRMRK
nr:hypothetical protein [Tanacetum cinerariifolium]